MSSSGLIYAVIVGAWAAYLVPMWLRRQDELNEARPTERFSTAIRLLSGRAGMERRYAKELKQRDRTAEGPTPDVDPDVATEPLGSADVRAFSAPAARTEARLELPEPGPEPRAAAGTGPGAGSGPGSGMGPGAGPATEPGPGPEPGTGPEPAHQLVPGATGTPGAPGIPGAPGRPAPGAAERARRGKVLARRRRTTTLLFGAFTLGAVVAAVGGVPFLWAPAVPALLLSAYIVHLRIQ
ncbi:gephyrin-like molybdotransferase receptor GlpR, partial [Streptomyces sp. CBMA370]